MIVCKVMNGDYTHARKLSPIPLIIIAVNVTDFVDLFLLLPVCPIFVC